MIGSKGLRSPQVFGRPAQRMILLLVSAVSLLVLAGSSLLAEPERYFGGRMTERLRRSCPGLVYTVALSPHGEFLAVGGEDIRIWNLRTGRFERLLSDETGWINMATFSPDGRWLVSGSINEDGAPGSLMIWDTANWKRRAVLLRKYGAATVQFSSDGRWLAAASATDYGTNYVWVWSVPSLRQVLRRQGYSCQLGFSPDGTALASWEKRGVRTIDIPTNRTLHWIPLTIDAHTEAMPTVDIHLADRNTLLVHTRHNLEKFDLRLNTLVQRTRLPGDTDRCLELPGKGILVIDGFFDPGSDPAGEWGDWPKGGYVAAWSIATGKWLGRASDEGPCDAVSGDATWVAGLTGTSDAAVSARQLTRDTSK